MDELILLAEARAAGLTVLVDEDRLRILGPRRAEALAKRLLEHKTLIVEALTTPDLTPADLPPELHLAWDKRSAIMEFDGCARTRPSASRCWPSW
jgi:hypothetical protein